MSNTSKTLECLVWSNLDILIAEINVSLCIHQITAGPFHFKVPCITNSENGVLGISSRKKLHFKSAIAKLDNRPENKYFSVVNQIVFSWWPNPAAVPQGNHSPIINSEWIPMRPYLWGPKFNSKSSIL